MARPRIKESVDLDVLQKYGFSKSYTRKQGDAEWKLECYRRIKCEFPTWKREKTKYQETKILVSDRTIRFYTMTSGETFGKKWADDLIKDGLVE